MVKLSDVELPIIFKNQLLFKSGNWNHISFSNDMVYNSVSNTKWSALNKRLYLKHDGAYDVSKWKGKVENIKTTKAPNAIEVRGDVEIWDAEEGIQIMHGGKPVAISADVEYNDAGTMFFTGFAIENDPGVRDNNMFLSDAVKNELSGMYHAKFSNELNTENVEQPKVETQPNPIDTQSAERGLIDKQNETMTEENKVDETQPNTDSDLAKQVIERMDKMEASMTAELAKVQPKEEPKQEAKVDEPATQPEPEKVEEPAKTEGTVADKPLSTVVPQGVDETMISSIADKVVEKIKPSLPQPVTINEFGSEVVDSEQATVNRLTESLAKM